MQGRPCIYATTHQFDSNIYEDEQSHARKAMPIISIYILGHKLKSIDEPVVHVKRSYYDHVTKKKISQQEDLSNA